MYRFILGPWLCPCGLVFCYCELHCGICIMNHSSHWFLIILSFAEWWWTIIIYSYVPYTQLKRFLCLPCMIQTASFWPTMHNPLGWKSTGCCNESFHSKYRVRFPGNKFTASMGFNEKPWNQSTLAPHCAYYNWSLNLGYFSCGRNV